MVVEAVIDSYQQGRGKGQGKAATSPATVKSPSTKYYHHHHCSDDYCNDDGDHHHHHAEEGTSLLFRSYHDEGSYDGTLTDSDRGDSPDLFESTNEAHLHNNDYISSSGGGGDGGSTGSTAKLGLIPLVVLIFYNVSGGPFGIEATVRAGGNLYALLGFLIFPFVWSVQEALMTAELGTTFPEASGGVAWVEEAFGPGWGWMSGYLGWISGGKLKIVQHVLLVPFFLLLYFEIFLKLFLDLRPFSLCVCVSLPLSL